MKNVIFFLCALFMGSAVWAAEFKAITPADFGPIRNPEMKFPAGDELKDSEWKAQKAKDPTVVWFKDRYLMYFSLFPKDLKASDCCLAIGIAESTDLTHWTFAGVMKPLGDTDSNGCGAPCAKVWDDQVHLFYQSYGNGPKDSIHYAVSDDGIHFRPKGENPIFFPEGDWTNGRGIDADFFEFKGKCFLYVATRDPEGKIQKIAVAVAENRDEIGRGKWKMAFDGPIMEPVLPWETRCIEAPTLIEHDGRAFMFYAGGYNHDPQHIGVAVSDDGIHFKRLWDVPLITNGPKGQWNSSESGHPGIFTAPDGQTYLFYQGNDTHGATWFLSKVRIGWKDGLPFVF